MGIIGLGYVGLPLARAFSKHLPVLGFDVDAVKVARLAEGRSYIGNIPDAHVARMLADGFEATADFDRLASVDAVIICVPTPLGPRASPTSRSSPGRSRPSPPGSGAGSW